jgi:hypothetical protein
MEEIKSRIREALKTLTTEVWQDVEYRYRFHIARGAHVELNQL